jgi:hypothetical protein
MATVKTMTDFVSDILDYNFIPDADFQYLMQFANFHHQLKDQSADPGFWSRIHQHEGLNYSFVADQHYVCIETYSDYDMEPRTSSIYHLINI